MFEEYVGKESSSDFDEQPVRKAMDLTFGTVKSFREIVKKYFESVQKAPFESFEEEIEKLSILKGTQLEVAKRYLEASKKMARSDLRFQVFSDSVIIYCSIDFADGRLPLRDILSMFFGIGAAKLLMMTSKKFFRGGLEIGCGIVDEDGFYEPALGKAYYLEHNKAKYPRVILGKKLVEFISELKQDMEEEVKEENVSFQRRFSWTILRDIDAFISKDEDNEFILNYLNPVFVNEFNDKHRFQIAYENIVDVITALERDLSQDKKIIERCERYKQLEQYFAKNQNLWKTKESS